MNPRLRKLGSALLTCVGVAWCGYQAVYGDGALRIFSVFVLVIAAVTGAGAVLDHVRPRPQRRRARERDMEAGG
ncbi:hypothetical protein ACFY71_30135 [Streptomyces cinerochromogenes]|uniref:hypothetical protein n=1 Tax=Streptomyces cinerochromogenes TaxID=66422 RepID=UPI0036A204CB